MFGRNCFKMLGLICIALPIAGCVNTEVSSLQITPATQTLAVGQTVQFSATGTIAHGSHPSTTQNVTDQVTWSSSTPSVATVNSSGMATAVSAGSATISASMPGTEGATATLTVTSVSGGTTGGTLTSLSIIPGTQSVASPTQTTQFIAIGTTSSGATEDVTSQAIWGSSSTQIATITSGGLATAVSQGTVTISAIATNANSTVVTGTASFTVSGGNSEPLTALTITPGAQSVSASGQQAQFIALGTQGTSGLESDVTSSPSLTWTSSIPTVATVSSSGLITGKSAGTTSITALWTNPDNSVVSGTAAVTVTTTAAPEPLLSLAIIPASITVGNLQDTGNFLAIGTFSTVPYVRDLTNTVQWISSAPDIFPVDTNSNAPNPGDPAGIVTAYGDGGATIIAEATSTDGTIQTATATFNCPLVLPNPNGNPPTPGSCFPGSQASGLKVTLTIYNEGLNTTNWLITAPSATGTPDVIHCGPGWVGDGNTGGSVCTAAYPLNTTVVVTAPAQTGVAFGGWSWSCTPSDAKGVPLNPVVLTATGPNYCTVTLVLPQPPTTTRLKVPISTRM